MSRALLLAGSPKPGVSASRSFAEAVGSRLEARGWDTRTERVSPAFADATRMGELLDAIAESDLVVLAFPVYVDSPPAPVLRLLETWESAIADGAFAGTAPKRLAVLTQCGFPEASHCDFSVAVCRRFAEKTGVAWAGALAFGMGAAIEGRVPEQSPLNGRIEQLDAAVDALAADDVIPAEATAAFARPLAPAWSYPLLGGRMWSRQAKSRGCTEPLNLRRYAQ